MEEGWRRSGVREGSEGGERGRGERERESSTTCIFTGVHGNTAVYLTKSPAF